MGKPGSLLRQCYNIGIAILVFAAVVITPLYFSFKYLNSEFDSMAPQQSQTLTSLEQLRYYHSARSGMLLTQVLDEEGNPYRWKAVELLMDLDYSPCFPKLMTCMEEKGDAQLVWYSLKALTKFGIRDALPRAYDIAISGRGSSLRIAALELLERVDPGKYAQGLANLLGDSDSSVSLAAARALAAAGDSRAAERLMASLVSGRENEVITALRYLGRLQSAGRNAVLGFLSSAADPSAPVIAAAAMALQLQEDQDLSTRALEELHGKPLVFWSAWLMSRTLEIMSPEERQDTETRLFGAIPSVRSREAARLLGSSDATAARAALAETVVRNGKYRDNNFRALFRDFIRSIDSLAMANGLEARGGA